MGRKRSWPIPKFNSRDYAKLQKTSVMIASVSTETRTEYLMNTWQDRHQRICPSVCSTNNIRPSARLSTRPAIIQTDGTPFSLVINSGILLWASDTCEGGLGTNRCDISTCGVSSTCTTVCVSLFVCLFQAIAYISTKFGMIAEDHPGEVVGI